MPLSRWFHSLLPSKASQTGAPPPPRGEGWGGEEQNDPSARIHIAAHDPAFPAKRETAIATLLAAINDVAIAAGFTAKPRSWAKSGPQGVISLTVQRSAYGWDCSINLGFHPISGDPTGIWAAEDVVHLGQFYTETEGNGPDPGTIAYLDAYENPASLDLPLHILATRALPWLEAHLTATTAPEIADFLPR